MIQVDITSKMPFIIAEQSRLMKEARRKALSNLVNETMLVTLPNSVSGLPVTKYSASKALNKQGIKKQQARIRRDMLGEDGNGWKRAPVAGDGSILSSKMTGNARLPLVVPKTGSGRRKSKAATPTPILNTAEAVRRWLKENTYLAWRRNAAVRVRKRGTKLHWVSKSALVAATKYLVGTSAGLMSGWAHLAQIAGNSKFAGFVSHRKKPNAPGSARLSDKDDKIDVSAVNNGLPSSPAVRKYQESQVNAWIPRKWSYAIQNELQHALIALNKFIKRLK